MTTPARSTGSAPAAHLLPLRPARPDSSLGAWLTAIAAEVARERQVAGLPPVAVHIDADAGHSVALDEAPVRAAVSPLVRSACTSSAAGRLREVVITTIDTRRGIEIEVADTGPDGVERLPASARSELAAARLACDACGGDLRLQDCPDGGVAVTIRFPHPPQVRSRAA